MKTIQQLADEIYETFLVDPIITGPNMERLLRAIAYSEAVMKHDLLTRIDELERKLEKRDQPELGVWTNPSGPSEFKLDLTAEELTDKMIKDKRVLLDKIAEIEVGTPLHLKPKFLTIIGNSVPEGEIHLRDENGKLVGKITNFKE